MRDYCIELFAEKGGYLVVVGDLSIVEGYSLVEGKCGFFLEILAMSLKRLPVSCVC